MKPFNPFHLFNRARRESGTRITEGSNVTRPGATVVLTQTQRFGIDLADYMQAIRSAENVDYTQRSRLYDIYSEALMDPHLFAVIQKRKSGTIGRRIEFRRDGTPDDRVNQQIASPWFVRFLEDALDAQFWGFSLMQFYRNEKGWIDYYLVPRKHVDPVLRLVKARQTDINGHPFDDFGNLMMVSGHEPLGILAHCAPYVIYKRGTLGDWAQFSELFGMPIRKYTYDAADPEALQQSVDAARSQGGAGVYFAPEGSNLEFVETGNTAGSSELYSTFVERCNAEMSKAVLGNTLTTEASETGTQALGTVHSRVEQELMEQDALLLMNLLNYEMTDMFASLGVDTTGGEFVFVEENDMEQVKARCELLMTAVRDLHLPVDDDYLYEQLNIEKPADYDRMKREMEERSRMPEGTANPPDDDPDDRYDDDKTDDDGIRRNGRATPPTDTRRPQNRFFAHAPQRDGGAALEF
jgi:phage gp29-like protein